MGFFNITIGDDRMCELHRNQYQAASLVYKQYVINRAGLLVVLQPLSTIVAAVVAVWGTASSERVWNIYLGFWSASWYIFFLRSWLQHAWWFRRSNWQCDHPDGHEDNRNVTIADDNNILHLPVKYSDN